MSQSHLLPLLGKEQKDTGTNIDGALLVLRLHVHHHGKQRVVGAVMVLEVAYPMPIHSFLHNR